MDTPYIPSAQETKAEFDKMNNPEALKAKTEELLRFAFDKINADLKNAKEFNIPFVKISVPRLIAKQVKQILMDQGYYQHSYEPFRQDPKYTYFKISW